MAGLHAGAILLLSLWTVWILIGLWLLQDRGPVLLIVFVPFALVLALATGITWRSYVMAWLGVLILLAALAILQGRRQVLSAAVSLGGLLWVWFQGGTEYSQYVVDALLAIAFTTAGYAICRAVTVRNLRRDLDTALARARNAELRHGEIRVQLDRERAQRVRSAPLGSDQTDRDPDAAHDLADTGYKVAVTRWNLFYEEEPLSGSPELRIRLLIKRDMALVPDDQFSDIFPMTDLIREAHHDEALPARFADAAKEFLAARAGDPGFAASTRWWRTTDVFPLVTAADFLDRSDEWLHRLVEKPFDAVGITSDVILAPASRQLNGATEFCEIVGLTFGLVTRLQPLAMSCTKLLVHRELNHALESDLRKQADPDKLALGTASGQRST
jgi:hypothetical protein